MNTIKKLSQLDLLALQFFEQAKHFNANVEPIKVHKSRTYNIGEANALIRAASEENRRYFFGINYLTVEEISNLNNPFVVVICGSIAARNPLGLHRSVEKANNPQKYIP